MLSFFLQYDIAHADVGTLMSKINDVIINPIVTFMFAVALLFFVFGIVQFLANHGLSIRYHALCHQFARLYWSRRETYGTS